MIIPPGRWHEYAAAISEGFCPTCRQPFSFSYPFTHVIAGRCDTCHCTWQWMTGTQGRHIGHYPHDYSSPHVFIPEGRSEPDHALTIPRCA